MKTNTTGQSNTHKDTNENAETGICCICGKSYRNFGNNPDPVKLEGRCCDECNRNKVLPKRMLRRSCGLSCRINDAYGWNPSRAASYISSILNGVAA